MKTAQQIASEFFVDTGETKSTNWKRLTAAIEVRDQLFTDALNAELASVRADLEEVKILSDQRVTAATAERDRYREALERIRRNCTGVFGVDAQANWTIANASLGSPGTTPAVAKCGTCGDGDIEFSHETDGRVPCPDCGRPPNPLDPATLEAAAKVADEAEIGPHFSKQAGSAWVNNCGGEIAKRIRALAPTPEPRP